jgi:hypothetical protein
MGNGLVEFKIRANSKKRPSMANWISQVPEGIV